VDNDNFCPINWVIQFKILETTLKDFGATCVAAQKNPAGKRTSELGLTMASSEANHVSQRQASSLFVSSKHFSASSPPGVENGDKSYEDKQN
jgi:hypothetical protein